MSFLLRQASKQLGPGRTRLYLAESPGPTASNRAPSGVCVHAAVVQVCPHESQTETRPVNQKPSHACVWSDPVPLT